VFLDVEPIVTIVAPPLHWACDGQGVALRPGYISNKGKIISNVSIEFSANVDFLKKKG